MSKIVTIYEALPDKVLEIVHLLEEKNLHPEIVDDTSKTGSYRSGYVRIAVPVTERELALKILVQAEQLNEKELKPFIKSTNKIILTIIALLAVVILVGFLDQGGLWFTITWLVITVFAGAALIKLAWSNHSQKNKNTDE